MDKKIEEIIQKMKAEKPEIVEELKTISEVTEVDVESIIEEWYELYQSELLERYNDEKRMVFAIRQLKAKYSNILMSNAKPFKLQVLDKTGIITGKKRNSDEEYRYATIYGICKDTTDDTDVVAFCKVNVYDKALEHYDEIRMNQTYNVKLNGKYSDDMFFLSTDDTSKFEETNNIIPDDVEKFFIDKYGIVEISDVFAEKPSVFSTSRYDLKVLHCDVINSFAGTSTTGKEYARYIVSDDSMNMEDRRRLGGLNVFVQPEQIRYATGSTVYIICSITKNDRGISANGYVILPEVVIEKYTVKYTEEEETKRKLGL